MLETPSPAGPVEQRPLKAAVEAVRPEAWNEDDIRQKSFEQHKHTRSLVMLFSNTWPDPVVEQRAGWDHMAGPANALMDAIIAKHYPPGGRVIRAMAAKLLSGGRIALHKVRSELCRCASDPCDAGRTRTGFRDPGLSHSLERACVYFSNITIRP